MPLAVLTGIDEAVYRSMGYREVITAMLVVVGPGLVTDQLVFGFVERRIRERWGLA